jgi:protein-tyrosine phosphatase
VELFETHKNPQNRSYWVPFGRHWISAAGSPSKSRFERWQLAGTTDIVTLQRHDEMPDWLVQQCETTQINWHHFPLSGRYLQAANDRNSLEQLYLWAKEHNHRVEPQKVVFHCAAGLHRTGLAMYLTLRTTGLAVEEVIAHIQQARYLTGQELSRSTHRGGKIAETAEQWFQKLSALSV